MQYSNGSILKKLALIYLWITSVTSGISIAVFAFIYVFEWFIVQEVNYTFWDKAMTACVMIGAFILLPLSLVNTLFSVILAAHVVIKMNNGDTNISNRKHAKAFTAFAAYSMLQILMTVGVVLLYIFTNSAVRG